MYHYKQYILIWENLCNELLWLPKSQIPVIVFPYSPQNMTVWEKIAGIIVVAPANLLSADFFISSQEILREYDLVLLIFTVLALTFQVLKYVLWWFFSPRTWFFRLIINIIFFIGSKFCAVSWKLKIHLSTT